MAGEELNKDAESPERAEAAQGEGVPGDDEVEARVREAVEAALAEQRDSVLRAQAEVQNMRRRCEMDVEKAHKFALERFGADLLSVVDNLERALQAAEEASGQASGEGVQALLEGVELTLKGFLETLNKYGIEQINPEGEPFDPQFHEAIATQPSDKVDPNSVLAVVQKGYVLNGRVIRPARVLVSKEGSG